MKQELANRVYYEDDKGEYKPTKKGIAVAPDKLDDLVKLLKKAQEELLRR